MALKWAKGNSILAFRSTRKFVLFFFPFSLSGGFGVKEREGPNWVPDVVSLCLSDHTAAWIFPFPFQPEQLPWRLVPGQKQWVHLTGGEKKRQSSHLHLRVLINPPKNKMLRFLIELMFRLIISSADEQDKHGLFILSVWLKPNLKVWLIL